MSSVLEAIVAHKRREVALARRLTSEAALAEAAEAAGPARGFRAALAAGEAPRIIAEVKRASPSRGRLAPGAWEPAILARRYSGAGAAALSVLTDTRFFWGQLADLVEARTSVDLPVLRKDFVVDPWQLLESRAAGADAVLLIAAALAPAELSGLVSQANDAGLDALVEIHDEREAEAAGAAGARLVGINNRDLATFEVDLAVTERLAPPLLAAGCTVVAESGFHTGADLARGRAVGVRAFLVGEALVTATDPGARLAELAGAS